jgi:hypothetical protein
MSSHITSLSQGSSSPPSVHEKDAVTVLTQPASEDGSIEGTYTQTITRGHEEVTVIWTPAEERKVVLKVDLIIMPLFAVWLIHAVLLYTF